MSAEEGPPRLLRGELVVIRLATVQDAERFAEIVCSRGVGPWWWPCWDADRWRRELTGASPHEPWFAVEYEGTVVGLMDYAEETDPDYESAGIDISLAEEWQGRGLGTDAVRTLACYLIDVRGHHRLTIDPAADNARSIHVYEKLGFKPVGVMRSYELGPDGWRDGLLMDLLAGELR